MEATVKKLLLLMPAMILCTPCESAARNEHLEPVHVHIAPDSVVRYYGTLLPILHSGFGKTPQARYTVAPSFSPEYAWSLENVDTDTPVLIVNTLKENLWYTRNSASATRRIPISRRLSTAIAELFQTVTGQIKKAAPQPVILDGVMHYFAATWADGKVREGETHSPDKGSAMDRLVVICEKIRALDGETAVTESGIEEDIASLIRELRK
jgi:hypothetical protein